MQPAQKDFFPKLLGFLKIIFSLLFTLVSVSAIFRILILVFLPCPSCFLFLIDSFFIFYFFYNFLENSLTLSFILPLQILTEVKILSIVAITYARKDFCMSNLSVFLGACFCSQCQ